MPKPAQSAQCRTPESSPGNDPDCPPRPALRRLLDDLGVTVRMAGASIWFHGASHETDGELFRALLDGRADVALVLTACNQASADALRWRHPNDLVTTLPRGIGIARFIRRMKPCALLLRDGESFPPALAARVRAAGVPIVDLRGVRIGSSTIASLAGRLPPMPERRQESPVTWQRPTARERIGESAAWRAFAPLFMRRRIDDLDALRQRLRGPRSILCLGNGPSSEDPRLDGYAHDCLIRVNWRWQARRFLDRPDIVFVGDPRTFRHVPPSIFGLWSVRHEHAMLLRRLTSCGPVPMTYFTVERLTPLAAESRWPARPTNGALAILTAALLAPERLVIAGIDLFSHPAGRYPGEPQTRNDYASVHDPEVELDLIDLALRGFRGEVVILSDALRRRLDARRERTAHAA